MAALRTQPTAVAVDLEVTSPWLVLIDPLALDLSQRALQALEELPETAQRQRLAAASPHLRIGVHEIDGFTPGRYRIDADDLVPTAEQGSDIVDVDSGAIVMTGLDRLPKLAAVLTWERYDASLRANGEAVLRQVRAALGGPRFALLSGDASRPFAGDGAYRLRRVVRIDR
jgi:hypothetical protein